MTTKILWFLNGIKLLVLLVLIWAIVSAYTLYLTWAILDYLNAVVELAQLY